MRVLLVYTDAEFYARAGYDDAWRQALEAEGADVRIVARIEDAWTRSGPPEADLCIGHVLNEELFTGADTARAVTLLEAAGVPALNPVASLFAAGDKLVSHAAWAAHGLRQPRTWALDDLTAWPADGELVLKSGWGDGAWEVTTAESLAQARAIAAGWRTEGRAGDRKPLGPMLLQERVHEPDCIRLYATPDTCSKAYEKHRKPGALKTYGTTYPRIYDPDPALARLAQRMVAAVGGGLMGVDVLRDADGAYWALEANGPFGFDVTDPAQGRWVARAALAHAHRRRARHDAAAA